MTRTRCKVPTEGAEDIGEDVNASPGLPTTTTTTVTGEVEILLAKKRVARLHGKAARLKVTTYSVSRAEGS